ncbi:MAG: hypothetical protein ACRDK4_08345 [Solirubrobacteraceae bacterium]
MEQIWEFLRKLACGLKAASELTAILAALIEALVGRFGPGFGFAG